MHTYQPRDEPVVGGRPRGATARQWRQIHQQRRSWYVRMKYLLCQQPALLTVCPFICPSLRLSHAKTNRGVEELRATVVERRSLTCELSQCCSPPAADG